MKETLRLDKDRYTVKEYEYEGHHICCRVYEDIEYCAHPKDAIQKMNIYVPEVYYHGGTIGKYSGKTAPVFLPNTVGGYMPGPSEEPGVDSHTGKLNLLFQALEHGYIAVSAGVRGRTTGKIATEFFEGSREGKLGEETGRKCGRAPAFLVDYKAAVRYLRHNRDLLPGDTEKIITNGTSAGGALSALAGASGNCTDYDPYLEEIGAADEKDDVFAASCFCPIHNLENADSAYEWQFCGLNEFYRTKHQRTENGIIRVPYEGRMNEEQISLSVELKKRFPSYVNSLGLKDEEGSLLTLDDEGEGSFKEAVKKCLRESAEQEYQTHHNEIVNSHLFNQRAKIDEQTYLSINEGCVTDLDWDAYIRQITRMKAAPAFDDIDMNSPENEEFGDETVDARHFTQFSYDHDKSEEKKLADPKMIAMMNPLSFIGEDRSDICRHWHIRHGSFDRDTSLAIPFILATKLENEGYDVDFAFPWGLPHSGDYDPEELFSWIDGICNN